MSLAGTNLRPEGNWLLLFTSTPAAEEMLLLYVADPFSFLYVGFDSDKNKLVSRYLQ